jgi:hypothetical protein
VLFDHRDVRLVRQTPGRVNRPGALINCSVHD